MFLVWGFAFCEKEAFYATSRSDCKLGMAFGFSTCPDGNHSVSNDCTLCT